MPTPLHRARDVEARARVALEELFGPERVAALLATLRARIGGRVFDAWVLALGVELERHGGPRRLREVGALRELLEHVDRYVDAFGG